MTRAKGGPVNGPGKVWLHEGDVIRPLRLVLASPEPTVGDRVMLGAEVGRAIRFSLATLDPKGTPNLTNEDRRIICLQVMAAHCERLDARRPGWLEVARGVGWLP